MNVTPQGIKKIDDECKKHNLSEGARDRIIDQLKQSNLNAGKGSPPVRIAICMPYKELPPDSAGATTAPANPVILLFPDIDVTN